MRYRRARDYTTLRHIVEQLLVRVSGDGWPARVAQRLGWQRPPRVIPYDLVVAADNPRRPPLRLAFASDFHAGPTTHPDVLAATAELLAELRPDVLLLGGDYVSLDARFIEPLATMLGAVPTRYGCYGVLGNHDLWVDEPAVARALTAASVRLLVNANVQLLAPYDDVWLCGLDDPGGGAPDADTALAGADGVRVVVMHSPEGLMALSSQRFDVALCGHTHGGQIVLPGGRPIWLPPGAYNAAYPHGRFALDGAHEPTLIVSRGAGYGDLPLRLFAPSDVLLVTLRWREAVPSRG